MKVILVIVVSILSISNASDTTEIVEASTKMEKAKEIFDSIKNNDFVKTMKASAKWGLPLLQSLSLFYKVILGSFAGESKELKFLKEQFSNINKKMDVVDHEFEEVKKMLDWNVIKVQYSTYESSINVLKGMVQELVEVPAAVRPMMVDRFLNSYHHLYNSGCDKVYESIVSNDRIFSTNLGTAVRKFTVDHRKKVEEFFIGNMKLIFNGLEVESFYYSLNNLTDSNEYWTKIWEKRIQTITKVMEQTVNEITDNWRSQLETDAETFNIYNYQKDNKEYLQAFYTFLNDKFFWREWFVIVYNPIAGEDNHYVSIYDGIIKFRARNHNVVVGSRDKNDKHFQQKSMEDLVNNIPNDIYCRNEDAAKCLLMNYLIPSFKNTQYFRLAAVLQWGGGVWYIGPSTGTVYRKWEGRYGGYRFPYYTTFNVIVMG